MSRSLLLIRACLALTLIAISLFGTAAMAQGATTTQIAPAALTAQAGEQMTLAVTIENVTNLTAFELHLTFDPNVLEVVGLANGGLIPADFVAQNTFDNTAGTIDYAVAQMNRPPAQGNGVLLNITLRAKANGSSNINLRGADGLILSDQNGIALQTAWTGGSINVGSGSATPIPPTATNIPPTTIPATATPMDVIPLTHTATVTPTNTPVSPTTASPLTTAAVRMDSATMKINDIINLFIRIDGASNLATFEIHLKFDPNTLEVKQIINGGFVTADMIAQNTFDNASGTVDYAITQNNRTSQGNGILLTISFRAKSAATSSRVDLRAAPNTSTGLLLLDPNKTSQPAAWTFGAITITDGVISNNYHTVRWGEWLYCIGRAYKVSPWAIAQANGINWWPYIIYPGQKLTIPNIPWTDMPAGGTTCQPQFTPSAQVIIPATPIPVIIPPTGIIPPTSIPVTPQPYSTCRANYTVRPGDTLYRIGLTYGVSYAEIAHVNHLPNAGLIYAGQQLCIPQPK